jgi:hypothetical protein
MKNDKFQDVVAVVSRPHKYAGEHTLHDVRNDPTWKPVQAVERRRDADTGCINLMINHLNYDEALENFNRKFEGFIK